MTDSEVHKPEMSSIISIILLVFLTLVLPGFQWSLFGWLHILLPLLSFYLLSRYGLHTGNRLLLTAVGLAFVLFLLLQRIDFFFLALSLLPVGYVLVHAANNHESPALSGMKAALTLTGCSFVVFAGLSIGSEVSFYSQLLTSLDEGISEALEYYRASGSITGDTLVLLENTLLQMRVIVPIIMPAILGSFVLLITWFTMVIGNRLIFKISGLAPWEQYRYWQLPEKLIWIVISMGAFTLIPLHPVREIGINGLILLSLVYCFQGMAIAVFFMDKWNIPILFRAFFYVMIIFQSFGTVLLLFLGIADIWFDFRKLRLVAEDTID